MEVMTCQPIHGALFLRKHTRRSCARALCGAGLAWWVVARRHDHRLNYLLVKGGMPIVAPWTVGLITQNHHAGAVLTLAAFSSSFACRTSRTFHDDSVVDGGVVVAVKATGQNRPSIQDVVSAAGAVKVNGVEIRK
jgi:hypothetical protein